MDFYVDEAPEDLSFLERKPTSVCHNGHEECSYRRGGPCWQYPCTCTTYGNCMACVPVQAGRVP